MYNNKVAGFFFPKKQDKVESLPREMMEKTWGNKRDERVIKKNV